MFALRYFQESIYLSIVNEFSSSMLRVVNFTLRVITVQCARKLFLLPGFLEPLCLLVSSAHMHRFFVSTLRFLIFIELTCSVTLRNITHVSYSYFQWSFFFRSPPPPPHPSGYLGHSAHTPASFSIIKTLFRINFYESVYGLARLHTTYITID